jgi:hypothetical protein
MQVTFCGTKIAHFLTVCFLLLGCDGTMQRIAFFAMPFNFKELCSQGTNSGSNQFDNFFSNKSKLNSCLHEGL